VHHWILVFPLLVACFRLCAEKKRSRLLLWLTCALAAALWLGVIWHVPNTHNREYHHNTWQILVGNSDLLLLIATLGAAFLASATARDAPNATAPSPIST
jgi:hypothetical protein